MENVVVLTCGAQADVGGISAGLRHLHDEVGLVRLQALAVATVAVLREPEPAAVDTLLARDAGAHLFRRSRGDGESEIADRLSDIRNGLADRR